MAYNCKMENLYQSIKKYHWLKPYFLWKIQGTESQAKIHSRFFSSDFSSSELRIFSSSDSDNVFF